MVLLLHTGLPIGEALGLRRCDMHLLPGLKVRIARQRGRPRARPAPSEPERRAGFGRLPVEHRQRTQRFGLVTHATRAPRPLPQASRAELASAMFKWIEGFYKSNPQDEALRASDREHTLQVAWTVVGKFAQFVTGRGPEGR
jgi:hypothetical protein